MSINSIHIYATTYLENIQKLFSMQLDKNCIILWVVPFNVTGRVTYKKFPKFPTEFSQKQTTEIICNCRRKLWNCIYYYLIFQKTFKHKEEFLKTTVRVRKHKGPVRLYGRCKNGIATEIFGSTKIY